MISNFQSALLLEIWNIWSYIIICPLIYLRITPLKIWFLIEQVSHQMIFSSFILWNSDLSMKVLVQYFIYCLWPKWAGTNPEDCWTAELIKLLNDYCNTKIDEGDFFNTLGQLHLLNFNTATTATQRLMRVTFSTHLAVIS